ncbi:DUF421 domain-containing protein [Bacillus fonticola]|uniref:DUF421 domain-containing protein n=1 Tax=Bacillus fonticola TaxID=2728853 RepID=UPI001475E51B|nr:DUF421 domain-containing protein [Bacillus fonticola]
MDFIQIALELIVGYVALFFLAKLLGKTQITQITAFDFISALVIGELVGNAIYDEEAGVAKVLFAVFFWGALTYITEVATQKFKRARNLLEGQPSIVIQHGKIQYDQLKKNHLDINMLQHLLRKKDVFSIRECEYAILETDGTVSVIKRDPFATVTKQDLSLESSRQTLPFTLIMDGEVIWDNLKSISKNKEWLLDQLKQQSIPSAKGVLYCEWQKGKALHIQTYDSDSSPPV